MQDQSLVGLLTPSHCPMLLDTHRMHLGLLIRFDIAIVNTHSDTTTATITIN